MCDEEYTGVVNSTFDHIRLVQDYVSKVQYALSKRAINHDKTKFSEEELPYFVEYTPKLSSVVRGSDKHKEVLEKLRPAVQSHHMLNRHHPEHFVNGVGDMDLIDIVEMVCDWVAEYQECTGCDINKSIDLGIIKFKINDQLARIIRNTVGLLISVQLKEGHIG